MPVKKPLYARPSFWTAVLAFALAGGAVAVAAIFGLRLGGDPSPANYVLTVGGAVVAALALAVCGAAAAHILRPPRVYDVDPENDITVANVTFAYDRKLKTRFVAVKNASLDLKRNLIYCVIGNSGSGKSTLVQHFNGLLRPESGELTVRGQRIVPGRRPIKDIKRLRRMVGLVFQFPEYQLFKETVEHDIMFGPIALGISRDEARKRAAKYLESVGLPPEYLQRSPFELSGGQKRRVALAGILAIETDIVVFDEPTAGLDPSGEREILDIIVRLREAGRTIVVVTHNMDHVLEIADRVLVMHDGELLVDATPFAVFDDTPLIVKTSLAKPAVTSIVETLRGRSPKWAKLSSKGLRTPEDLAKAIAKAGAR